LVVCCEIRGRAFYAKPGIKIDDFERNPPTQSAIPLKGFAYFHFIVTFLERIDRSMAVGCHDGARHPFVLISCKVQLCASVVSGSRALSNLECRQETIEGRGWTLPDGWDRTARFPPHDQTERITRGKWLMVRGALGAILNLRADASVPLASQTIRDSISNLCALKSDLGTHRAVTIAITMKRTSPRFYGSSKRILFLLIATVHEWDVETSVASANRAPR
jgi:hypothetical protein